MRNQHHGLARKFMHILLRFLQCSAVTFEKLSVALAARSLQLRTILEELQVLALLAIFWLARDIAIIPRIQCVGVRHVNAGCIADVLTGLTRTSQGSGVDVVQRSIKLDDLLRSLRSLLMSFASQLRIVPAAQLVVDVHGRGAVTNDEDSRFGERLHLNVDTTPLIAETRNQYNANFQFC